MATYFIGDIQGCFDELMLLLKKLNFDHHQDRLYLTGDLIGRGPNALETLDFITRHQASISTVLGNHDLHFLAISCGIKQAKPSDKFDQLLDSPRLKFFVDYLRHQPLLIELPQHQLVITHAGISPQWDLTAAKQAAIVVEKHLKSENYSELLNAMYCNQPSNWHSCNSALERSIYTINALTRMRYCYDDGQLELTQKCPPSQQSDPKLQPWFYLANPVLEQTKIIFGHWASLEGTTNNPQALALDTGCLWGQYLSAWHLEENIIIQQSSLMLSQ